MIEVIDSLPVLEKEKKIKFVENSDKMLQK
jgi:hypothetical protein